MNKKTALSKIGTIIVCYLIVLILPDLILQLFKIKGATAINVQVLLTAIGAAALIWLDRKGDKKLEIAPDKKLSIADKTLYGVGGMILLYATEIVGSVLIILLFGQPNPSQNTQQILEIVKIAPAFIIYGVVLAPIMEEVVFRKNIYGVGRKLINPLGAALVSALLFGLAHNDNNFLIVYAGIGLALCWLYKRTNSIVVNIIAHGLFNGITMALALLIR
ncbi:CPBP family intramembrane glutamic endopeptidase [Lapidilactobacillus mulanensis]|uniref:CPBP family intramembrane glutamic endopeptidase n=1 Tax=Lapidilactobacillus mulanensis TaxID=2485999 RepID=A0ABW4DTC5_9LACO|nr:type II CAAX endopeptidase family protein [Lapidilactobacillus mulanensis]